MLSIAICINCIAYLGSSYILYRVQADCFTLQNAISKTKRKVENYSTLSLKVQLQTETLTGDDVIQLYISYSRESGKCINLSI